MRPDVCIVVPTLGRSSLDGLLAALPDDADWEVVLVDDRPDQTRPLSVPGCAPGRVGGYPKVISGRGAGPAAARNLGWRSARAPWVVFLDDDVRPAPDWGTSLAADLAVGDDVGGVQGRLRVPLPPGRRPTDWERSTHGLVGGWWITADMAYRRDALEAVGGFDERFPRAFREDSELAYRVVRAGWRLVRGRREVVHPVRPEGRWVSVRVQRGNRDDALLRHLYGPGWPELLGVARGRRRLHAATTAAGCLALLAAVASCCAAAAAGSSGRAAATAGASRCAAAGAVPRLRWAAVAAAAGWLGLTAQFAAVRVRPGPRTPAEVTTMVLTSVAIPPLAIGHWLRGWIRWRHARPISPSRSRSSSMRRLPDRSTPVEVYFS